MLATPLVRLCRSTITDPDKLRTGIEEVRSRGWAISFEETDPDVWGIAVPLIDPDGAPVAALGLAGPSGRLRADDVRRQLARLGEEAARLAERFGYSVPALDLSPHRRAA